MVFKYQQSYDKSISDDLKARRRNEIEILEKAGFSFFSMHRETIWPFSAFFFFPIYLMMSANEYVRIESPLRITSYHLLYLLKEKATLAYVYGMGCKFYTRFADRTWLVSNTVQKIRDEKIVVIKRDVSSVITVEQALENHEIKIREQIKIGKRFSMNMTFDSWVEVESQFDQSNLVSTISMGLVWTSFLIWVVSWMLRRILGII